MKFFDHEQKKGALLNDPIPVSQIEVSSTSSSTSSSTLGTPRGILWQSNQAIQDVNAHRWAFISLYLFTLLLFARPNDWVPGMGSFPLVKIITLIAPVAYLAAIIARGDRLSIWPTELKMLLLILALCVLFIPVAQSKEDSINLLIDPFIKVVIIFILLINVITTRARLQALLKLVVVCGTVLAIGAIRSYLKGEFTKGRIEGAVGGIFQNANDLATMLNILLAIAIALAFTSKGVQRLMFAGIAALMGLGIILTFSRAGFLALVAITGWLFWRLRRRHRVLPVLAALVLVSALSLALPGGYGERLATIFKPSADKTESAQERSVVLMRALNTAIRHPIVGVSIGNFYLYSRRDLKAHNSYLEIWAELGLLGLGAYLVMLFAPLRSLRRIEDETLETTDSKTGSETNGETIQTYYFSIGLQAALVAYLVCSFFSSIQYHWFVYYPIAFAIALRRIHAPLADVAENKIGQIWQRSEQTNGTLWNDRPVGTLWASQHASPASSLLEASTFTPIGEKEKRLLNS